MTDPTMSLQDIAERYESAQCVKYGRPTDWDVEGAGSWWALMPSRPPRYVTQLMAAALCEDCPLLRMCASDALAERPTGVIRAGLPVTRGDRPPSWQEAIWRAVAAGGDLRRSIAGLSGDWDPAAAVAWIDRYRPWTSRDLARLPRRARLIGARPEGARGSRGARRGGRA